MASVLMVTIRNWLWKVFTGYSSEMSRMCMADVNQLTLQRTGCCLCLFMLELLNKSLFMSGFFQIKLLFLWYFYYICDTRTVMILTIPVISGIK